MYFNYFLYSGNPGPGMLDIPRMSINKNLSTKILIIDRGLDDLLPDISSLGKYIKFLRFTANGISLKRILFIPYLIYKIYKEFLEIKSSKINVNVHTLDCLIVVVVCKYIFHSKNINIIYQIRDLHTSQHSKGFLFRILQFFESKILNSVGLFLFSSERFADFYKKKYNIQKKYMILENIPRPEIYEKFKSEKIRICDSGKMVIGYIGILRYFNSINYLIKSLNNTNRSFSLYVAGGGDKTCFSNLNDKIDFHNFGSFNYINSIVDHYNHVDLIYAVYDSSDYNCQIAMPNKFYESILFKKPIIVASNTYLSDRVLELGIGISVDINTSDLLVRLNNIDTWYFDCLKALNLIDSNKMVNEYNSVLENIVSYNE